VSGTASLLDLLSQTPSVQVAFDAKAGCNYQGLFPRRMLDLAHVPKRPYPVLGESAVIQTLEVKLDFRGIHAFPSSIGDSKGQTQARR